MKPGFWADAEAVFRSGPWKERRFSIIFLSVVFLTACLPLFTVNCINGDDVTYHLLRIESLSRGINMGLPFLRVNVLFFGGAGYASSLFYPDLLLYIPALLRCAGVGINASYHIFVAVCVLLGMLSAYFSARFITGRAEASLIVSAVYTLCQYHIDDIYTRSAAGEFTAYIFLPLVIAGIYDLLYKDYAHPYILCLGMAGVVLCHTLTTVLCLLLGAAAVLAGIRLFIRKPSVFIRLLLSGAVVILLTAFYTIPLAEQLLCSSFRVSEASFDVDYEKLLLVDVFKNEAYRMGIAPYLLLLPRLLTGAAEEGERKEEAGAGSFKGNLAGFADFLSVCGLAGTLCTTGAFPWGRFSRYLSFVQFPWRLFEVVSVLLSFSAGIYILCAAGDRIRLYAIAALMIMIVSCVSNYGRIDKGYYSYSDDYFDYDKYTAEVIGGEWLPETVESRSALLKRAGTALSSEGEEIDVVRDKNALEISSLDGDEEYLDVPFVYYRGYSASDGEGGRLRLDGSGENGLVRVYPEGKRFVRVEYAGTAAQKAADIISALTFLGLAGIEIIYLIKNLTKEKEKYIN